jgi:V/A-type H+-transporting ATPase subunit D
MEEALMYPKQGVAIELGKKNVMSVNVPVFDFTTKTEDKTDIYPYGFATTSGELDKAIARLAEVFPLMLELAAMEKEASLLAQEIEKTRRRVNALEYIMIPNLEETIKYIKMKLDENERGNQVRLMKVKDMMLAEAIQERRAQTEAAFEDFSRKH